MKRKVFVTLKKVASILELDERTVRNWCEQGWCHAEQFGPDKTKDGKPRKHRPWRIPTVSLRREHPNLPIEFWEEIVEDEYRGLDGRKSAEMRLERRRNGQDPANGKPISKPTGPEMSRKPILRPDPTTYRTDQEKRRQQCRNQPKTASSPSARPLSGHC